MANRLNAHAGAQKLLPAYDPVLSRSERPRNF